jgi:hypothetical protein
VTSIWQGRFDKNSGNPAQCRESVHDREGGGFFPTHQCVRKPVCTRVIDGKEYGFCKQHDPEAVKARDKKRHEQWKLESEARSREYDRTKRTEAAMDACKEAIEKIANGHNDPRTLALETLRLFP